ncbi:MAG: hypothetical protein IPP59_05635 [Betaproteobacteria bacterium]|nr:hypothetical protein [Candidatus Dechloromonas phosphorivorans]
MASSSRIGFWVMRLVQGASGTVVQMIDDFSRQAHRCGVVKAAMNHAVAYRNQLVLAELRPQEVSQVSNTTIVTKRFAFAHVFSQITR